MLYTSPRCHHISHELVETRKEPNVTLMVLMNVSNTVSEDNSRIE